MTPFRSSDKSATTFRRTLWTYELSVGGTEILKRTAAADRATFIASLTDNGLHAPAFDIDRQIEATELLPGLTRLVFPYLQPNDAAWESLVDFMGQAGLLAKPGEPPISETDPRYAEGCSEDAAAERRRKWESAVDGAMEGKSTWDSYLDLIVPVDLRASSTREHFHAYLDVEMPWSSYRKFCKLLVEVGLIEHAWLSMADKWKMTTLLKPGLTKEQLLKEKRPLPCMLPKTARSSSSDY